VRERIIEYSADTFLSSWPTLKLETSNINDANIYFIVEN
jgi:hypothetical protein